MERRHIDVRFAYEYGDKSLPKIKELVCEKPDSQKQIILEYLERALCNLLSRYRA